MTLVLQLLPFLRYGGLLLGASLVHARFHLGASSGVPVLPGLHCATFFLPLFILGVFLGYHQIDSPFSSVLQSVGAFLLDAFSLSLVTQSPRVLAFSRRQCIFAFVASLFKDKVYPFVDLFLVLIFAEHFLIRSDLQKAVHIVPP